MKCYQYDNQGYFQFVTDDYGQGLPNNSTYMEPPDEKDGFLLKFNGKSWEYKEIPKEDEVIYVPTKQDLLDKLNSITKTEMEKVYCDLLLSLSHGSTLEEAQSESTTNINKVATEYKEAVVEIEKGNNPFEEVV